MDSSNGEMLWEFQTGAGVNTTATVFEDGGEQYVVVYAGGNMFAGSPRGDRLWLFSLSGELGPEQPPRGEDDGQADDGDAEPDEVAIEPSAEGAMLAIGGPLYDDACATCHGDLGEGGHGGPELLESMEIEDITSVLHEGPGRMPSFTEDFTPVQMRALAEYVKQLRR